MTERPVHARGFTLVEVMIVTSIIGLISATIAVVFTVIVRSTPSTESRADDARSLLGISIWLPADVSSTPIRPIGSATANWDTTSTRASGCTGSDTGTNLLRLAWSEQIGSTPRNFVSSYRLVDNGATSSIVRVICENGGAPTKLGVSSGLPPVSAAPVTVAYKTSNIGGVDHIVGIELEIDTLAGDTLRVDAASRNPDQTLSTVPTAVTTTTLVVPPTTTTTTTSTTTTTTTTTAPPGPTTTTTAPTNIGPVAVGTTFTGRRDQPISVTLAATDANLDPLTPSIPSLPTGWTATFGGPNGLTATISAPGAAAGTYALTYTVTDPSMASATANLTIQLTPVPCITSFASVTPNPVANTGNGNAAKSLAEPVTVSINKSGDCGNLTLRYHISSSDVRSKVFGTGNTVTLEAVSTERYTPGAHLLELVEFEALINEIVHQTRTLTVT